MARPNISPIYEWLEHSEQTSHTKQQELHDSEDMYQTNNLN